MKNSERVAILLATYNGEKYLDEQIRSLLGQTYPDIVVIVRDDHSSDRTPEILARWSAAEPDKISVVSDNRGNLRSLGNFSLLMEVCDAPYFAFCDQDDVWLPEKIDLTINEVRRQEEKFGKTTPVLVHSDLKVVDEELQVVSPSFFAHLNWNISRRRQLRSLLFNNVVTGCALMGNRALLELARPIPDGIPYHDWWVALVAASCGVLSTVPDATVLYRQHNRNQVGAGPRLGRRTLRDVRYTAQQPRKLKALSATIVLGIQLRASLLLRIAGDKMPPRSREFLRALSLPRIRDETVCLPWTKRTWLFVRFLMLHLSMLPSVVQWCVAPPHMTVEESQDAKRVSSNTPILTGSKSRNV